jgi:predicted metal-binding membrane protein
MSTAPRFRRLSRGVAKPDLIRSVSSSSRDIKAVVFVAAAAWVGVVMVLRGSGMGMGSTMGLSLVVFLGAWALMMAAMMLPAVAPVASLYVRAIGAQKSERIVLFAAGYLLVWSLIGLPAFAVAVGVDAVAVAWPAGARWGVILVLAAVAAYQLTPLKRMCLAHCRSPLSQLLHYANYRAPLRDLKVGFHHGLYCVGCCWPLMLLLVAVGTMNLGAMLTLTAVVLAEKTLPHEHLVSRGIAFAAVCSALLFAISPTLFDHVAGM